MKVHPVIRVLWIAIHILVAASFIAVLYGIAWEYSTRSYLQGFADATIPANDNPEQKVESILIWIAEGPARRSAENPAALSQRDPADTLNFQQLLRVCGTATNAFVNLAEVSGLPTRRLLLRDASRNTKHVVAEVYIGSRWILVDPAYHTIFHFPDGRLVTRADMLDLNTFRQVTSVIPDYPQDYTYESTARVRLSRIPVVGRFLRGFFNAVWPSWEDSINWTLLLERESFAMLSAALVFLFLFLAARELLSFYMSRRLGITGHRLRDQFVQLRRAASYDAGQ